MGIDLNRHIQMLVVDEHSFITGLENEGYRLMGVQAYVASDVEEVKKLLTKQNIDVILINWEYRNFDPCHMVRFIRSIKEYKNVPVVVTSIHRYTDKLSEVKEIDLFVKQPIPRVLLLEKIRRLLNQKNREQERLDLHDLYLGSVKVSFGKQTHTLTLVDVSTSGVFLYSEIVFPKGQIVNLEVTLPGLSLPLKVAGEVTRTSRMHKINDTMNKGIGIQFTEFQDNARDLLARFIADRKLESSFISYYL